MEHINLKEALNMEKMLQEQIAAITKNTVDGIAQALLPGVETDKNAGVRNATVSFSTIAQHGFVLSPEYYIQESQAEIVGKYLGRSKTVTDLIERIKNLVNSGFVPGEGARHKLNPNTLNVLKGFVQDI